MTLDQMASIDIVLLSCSSNLLALPYFTEYSKFRGRIFATEPTLIFGRLQCETYLASDTQLMTIASFPVRRYTKQDMDACLAKVTIVRFREVVPVGLDFWVRPSSSGFGLGACYWNITKAFQKVVYISSATLSGSRHSSVFDKENSSLADVVIVSDVTSQQTTIEKSVGVIFSEIGSMNDERQAAVFRSQAPSIHTRLLDNNKLIVHRDVAAFLESISAGIVLLGYPLPPSDLNRLLSRLQESGPVTVVVSQRCVISAQTSNQARICGQLHLNEQVPYLRYIPNLGSKEFVLPGSNKSIIENARKQLRGYIRTDEDDGGSTTVEIDEGTLSHENGVFTVQSSRMESIEHLINWLNNKA
ncbi:hypothetical protein HDU67_000448 [Dinochytrium kinnereticum]|nr:hypothetical protein HDU67_000448 [Dinochytrium kinnereticum]